MIRSESLTACHFFQFPTSRAEFPRNQRQSDSDIGGSCVALYEGTIKSRRGHQNHTLLYHSSLPFKSKCEINMARPCASAPQNRYAQEHVSAASLPAQNPPHGDGYLRLSPAPQSLQQYLRCLCRFSAHQKHKRQRPCLRFSIARLSSLVYNCALTTHQKKPLKKAICVCSLPPKQPHDTQISFLCLLARIETFPRLAIAAFSSGCRDQEPPKTL